MVKLFMEQVDRQMKKIDNLQRYNGLAVRNNVDNITKMKKALS